MSSRFISGGAIDPKTGESVPVPSPPVPTTTTDTITGTKKSDEWAAVQSQLETERQARAARAKAAQQGAGEEKSLYDVLQANKAAKQAAFEEANKIKNQFRALDDDEIDFLDEVERRKREEQERVRRETEEGLMRFREAQKGGGEAGDVEGEGEGGEEVVEGGWAVGRKRKRRKGEAEGVGGLLKGVKRRVSTGAGGTGKDEKGDEKGDEKEEAEEKTLPDVTKQAKKAIAVQEPPKRTAVAAPAAPSKPKAGLVDYGSDDDGD